MYFNLNYNTCHPLFLRKRQDNPCFRNGLDFMKKTKWAINEHNLKIGQPTCMFIVLPSCTFSKTTKCTMKEHNLRLEHPTFMLVVFNTCTFFFSISFVKFESHTLLT